MKKICLLFFVALFINSCNIHKIATEEDGFNDDKKLGLKEGIAVFYFKGLNDSALPNEIYFKKVNDNNIKHFTPSSLLYNKETSRFIVLEAGKYQFLNAIYKIETQYEEYSFPENEFIVEAKKINYIGDILLGHKEGSFEVKTEDNMNLRLAKFYPDYPKSSIYYQKVKNLVKFEANQLEKWFNEQRKKNLPKTNK